VRERERGEGEMEGGCCGGSGLFSFCVSSPSIVFDDVVFYFLAYERAPL
jgi:hypothetical protein